MSQLEKQLADAKARVAECADEIEAVPAAAEAEGREMNDSDNELVSKLMAESNALCERIPQLQAMIDQRNKIAAAAIPDTPPIGDPLAQGPAGQMITRPAAAAKVPAQVKYFQSKVFDSNQDAYDCGMWLGAIVGHHGCQSYCRNRGMDIRTDMEGGTPTLGGYSVPTPMAATIIRLVEEHGVFRRNARPAVMTSNTLLVPKYDAGLTVYYISAEGGSITGSDLTYGQVVLNARKYATWSALSTELQEDAVINTIDLITTDIGTQMAKQEDTNSFLGDGSAGSFDITGIQSALQAGSKVNIGGAAWSNLTRDHLSEAVGKMPLYAGAMGKWYMSSYAYHTAVLPLLFDQGGTDMRQVEAGGQMMLMGYPVEFTQVLPKATVSADDLLIVFGDLNLGAYSGQSRNLTIRVLSEILAQNDQLAVQSTMRADSVIHSVGTATEAGAIIGIYASV